ncbi:alpha/beta fold hydrolase [Mycobacterium intracellulare]|uniref:alpha/beta fold hydrolase n=1 Tax=Mycobacterium intracellulare TaxID=1767 RepID=UPI001CDA2CDF|nr:alpha/beta fold hydrolase [Mycobacterium intracellulare]MCA2304867.1 alpha/beta fold hydrolase [Mycobacterium intracellulare]MCA2347102.1 alpha/beta fold hydrolase [Mycobacterium intracellulare]
MASPALAVPSPATSHPPASLIQATSSIRPRPLPPSIPHLRSHIEGNTTSPRTLRVRTVDGVDLAVNDFGSRHPRHTIVFLHGLCLNSSTWDAHIERIRQQYGPAVRLISYDHRGHGRSASAALSSYTIEQLADDLAQVLLALDVTGSLTVVAHSMGGMTVLAYLQRPKRQRPVEPANLVLIATAAGKLTQRGLGRLLAAPGITRLLSLGTRTPEHLLCRLLKPVCGTVTLLGSRIPLATLAAMTLTALSMTAPSTALGFLAALRNYDLYPALHTVAARTTIITGAADPITPPAHGRDMAAAIPGARYVSVPGAGHMLPQQAFAVIDRAIAEAVGPITAVAAQSMNNDQRY